MMTKSESPGDLLSKSLRALERDDLDPLSRAAFAVVVASGGSMANGCQWEDAAEIAGVSVTDLRQSLIALRERRESPKTPSSGSPS